MAVNLSMRILRCTLVRCAIVMKVLEVRVGVLQSSVSVVGEVDRMVFWRTLWMSVEGLEYDLIDGGVWGVLEHCEVSLLLRS